MGKKWNKDSGPGEKLLRLFSLLLFAHERYSLTALAEILECSKQTVLRLVDQLEAARWAKVRREDVGRRALFWIERPGALPKVSLSPEGLRELMLCRAFLEHMLPRSLDSGADTVLRQAAAYITEPDFQAAACTGKIGGALSKGRIDYSPMRDRLETLLQAASQKIVLNSRIHPPQAGTRGFSTLRPCACWRTASPFTSSDGKSNPKERLCRYMTIQPCCWRIGSNWHT